MRFHRGYFIEEQSGFQAEKWQKFLGYQSTEVLNFGFYRMAYRIFHLTNFLSLQIKGQACPQFFWISFWTVFLFLRLLAISVDVTETGRCFQAEDGGRSEEPCSTDFNHEKFFFSLQFTSLLTAHFPAFVINETLMCPLKCSEMGDRLIYKQIQGLLRHNIHPKCFLLS